jgi:hypothetical protein
MVYIGTDSMNIIAASNVIADWRFKRLFRVNTKY